MRTLIFVLLAIFCLCDLSKGHGQDVILLEMVRTAIEKMELLSEQLQELRGESQKELREFRGESQEELRELREEFRELRGEFDVLKELQRESREEFRELRGEFREELQELKGEFLEELRELRGESGEEFRELGGEFDVLKSQIAEGCSKQDNMIQIFQGLIEKEVELGKDIVNQTCSATQLASLQDTFMTDLQTLRSRMETDLKRSIETQTTTIQTELEAVKQSASSDLIRESSRIKRDLQSSIETQTTTIQTELETVKQSTSDLNRQSSRIKRDLKRSIETQTTTIQTELETVKESTSDLKRQSSKIKTDLKRSIESQTTTIQAGMQRVIATAQHCSSKEQLIEGIKQLAAKDECQDGSNNCSPKATCQDQLLGYKCQCLSGYSGDGFNCTAPPCPSPSALIDGLGCVTPFKVGWKNWQDAKAYCLALGSGGSRLLEGITSQEQLNSIKEKFYDYLGGSNPWIGTKANPWRYVESGDSVDPSKSSSSSTLWDEGQPDNGDEGCGTICLGCSRPSLSDFPCSVAAYFLCQRIQ